MCSSLHFTPCSAFKRVVALTLCCSHQPFMERCICLLVSNFPFFNRQGASWSGKFGWKRLTIPTFFFVCLCVCCTFILCHALKRSSHKVGAADRESVIYLWERTVSTCVSANTHTHTHVLLWSPISTESSLTRPVLSWLSSAPCAVACLAVFCQTCD